jgi:hypothetical protein
MPTAGWRSPCTVAIRPRRGTWGVARLLKGISGSCTIRLATSHPEKLKELQALWDGQTATYNVYPLYDDFTGRIADVFSRFGPEGNRFEFYPPGGYRFTDTLEKVEVTLDQ